jgi:hypothetical protein
MANLDSEPLDEFFSTDRVQGRDEAVLLGTTTFRDFLYDDDDDAVAPWRGMGYEEFTAARSDNPFLQELLGSWNELYAQPFVGLTSDGVIQDDLYRLPKAGRADAALVAAAEAVVSSLTSDELAQFKYPLDAREWRAWSNPEFVFHRVGLRLENLSDEAADAMLSLVEASLSAEGYQRVREAMGLNGFLGELVGLPEVMNDRSYWVSLFGDPFSDEPWGWQLFGHHVAINFVTVGGRDVIAPVFLGAEPALSDGARPPIFDAREKIAIELASSLTADQRRGAVVYDSVLDTRMPPDRLHPADERHVAGAFRDNRIVPYEGLSISAFDDTQRRLLRAIVEDFFLLLREPHRAAALADFDSHLDETWFSWYGATDGSQPIYFRIHSPVVIAELDNHAGVWLANRVPARFHVHTTLRLPNGNDYGRALIAQWRTRPHDTAPEN